MKVFQQILEKKWLKCILIVFGTILLSFAFYMLVNGSLKGPDVELYQPVMRDNLRVFANANNFPVAFHCAVGRDRTGTLAITLHLLLGVKQNQIKQDYIVSFFSKACNEENIYAYESSMMTLFNFYTTYRGRDLNASGNIYKRVET